MKIGLALPHYDFSFPDGRPVTVERVLEYAVRAEALGFESVWVSDHLFLDLARYGGPPDRQRTPEAMALLTAIAARTSRVRLGPLVLCVPFRHPRILAHEALSIADLSGGRLELGLGAGWYEAEFTAASIPFGTVGSRMRNLERAASMLDGHLGKDVPLFIGGKGGPRILRIVARSADAWNVVWTLPPDLEPKIAALRDACLEEGRDPAEVRTTVGLYTLLGRDERDLEDRYRAMMSWMPGRPYADRPLADWARDTLTGTTERCAETIGRLEAMGVDRVIVSLAPLPFSVFDDEQLEIAASALMG